MPDPIEPETHAPWGGFPNCTSTPVPLPPAGRPFATRAKDR